MEQVVLESESTLTDRYQTTIPEAVRSALHLQKRDKIKYRFLSDGSVVLSRAEQGGEDDPVIAKFLDFLARDMEAHPERLKPIPADLMKRVDDLVGDMEVDLDAPLDPEDD